MLCNRNVPDLTFGKLLGEARTLLPVSTAVTYIYTLLCAPVVKHTPRPIALSGFNSTRPPHFLRFYLREKQPVPWLDAFLERLQSICIQDNASSAYC